MTEIEREECILSIKYIIKCLERAIDEIVENHMSLAQHSFIIPALNELMGLYLKGPHILKRKSGCISRIDEETQNV